MNKAATVLLALTAVLAVGFGASQVVYWVSRPVFFAGEMASTAVGVIIVLAGVGIGLAARGVSRDRRGGWIGAGACSAALLLVAYIALNSPGYPVPFLVGAAVVGVALAGLVLARAAGRAAP
jgi:hypothetical protein